MMYSVPTWLTAVLAEMDSALAPVQVARPDEGIANVVLLVETTGGPVVVKRYDDARRAQTEVAANDRLRRAGLPAPQALGLVAVEGGAVVAFERLPGVTWNVALASRTEPEIAPLYGQLGELVGQLHGVTGAACGRLPGGAPGRSWRAVHAAEVDARLAEMRGTAFDDLVPLVARFMAEQDAVLDGPVTPRLLHMDLHGGNILVDGDRISGVVDAEEALWGHHEYELMRLELAHFRGVPAGREAAFLASYAAVIPLEAGWASRARVYEVSRATAWAVSVLRNRAAADAVETVRASMVALVAGG